jgi:hypothetical protein
MNDDIAKHLGLAPLRDVVDAEIIESKPKRQEIVQETSNVDRDYKYARENFISIIENGTRALEDLLDVATQSQHPRAYEVLAATMKTLIDANKDLVELSRKQKEMDTPKQPDSKVTNNLFVGSTADLQKVLKELRNEKNKR